MNFQFFDYQEKLHFDFYIPIPVGFHCLINLVDVFFCLFFLKDIM